MELYINNILVDLNQRIPFPLTYNISDIKDLSARKGNNSKTITLPGTKTNYELMLSVFSVSISDTADTSSSQFINYDPSVKAEARYYDEGILQFQGVCQLQECILLNGTWSFNIILISESIDYISRLAKIKVNELGWSEYDHAFTRQSQIDSWDGIVQYNGSPVSVYTSPDWDGTGYYYGLIDYGYSRTAPNYFDVDQILPQVHCYEILKKAFDYAEISWSSNFLESQIFKRLLLAWGGGDLPTIDSAQSINDSAYTSEQNNGSGFLIYNGLTISPIVFTDQGGTTSSLTFPSQTFLDNLDVTIVQDNLNQVDVLAPMRFTAASEGLFNINYYGDHEFKWDISFQFGTLLTNIQGTYFFDILVYKNNALIATDVVYSGSLSGASMSYTTAFNFDYNRQINLLINDTVTIKVRLRMPEMYVTAPTTQNETASYTTSVETLGSFLDIVKTVQEFTPGGTISLVPFLPDMDCATFFKGIITAFNLYVKPSVDNAQIMEIEPLNDFYDDSSQAIVWTEIVDRSKEIKVTPTINFASKNYVFQFENDDDFFNSQYLNDVDKQYGSFLIQSQNQFATGDTTFKLPFSQKLLVNIPFDETTFTGLIVPRSFQVKFNEDGSSEVVFKKGKPFLVQLGDMTTGNWYHVDEVGTAYLNTTYPYVGHLDNLTAPTFDFNWGAPYFVYWQSAVYTTNNLYNYHEKFLKEIISPFGKKVDLSAKINAEIINTLDFKKLINIDGVVYRLQKVADYDSTQLDTTKIELIRILEGESIGVNNPSLPDDPFTKQFVRATEDGIFRETEDGLDNRRVE